MRIETFILSLFLALWCHNVVAQISLNEWVIKNSTGITDADGDHSDWVEIYNGAADPIDLSGYGISDELGEPYKWTFPAITIQPGEFLLVFCSDKDRFLPDLHANFKLSGGDILLLTDAVGNTVQSFELSDSPYDVSEGGIVDGSSQLKQFYTPTPGSTNLDGVLYNRIELSRASGFHPEPFLLSISSSEGHEVRYTTDGSEPTIADPVFPPSIEIADRSSEPLNISSIPTTAPNIGPSLLWETPDPNQFKGTVFRLRSFHNGEPTSHVITASYFVHPSEYERYSLPVVSIITDSLNLFDYDTGIYVPGLNHDQNPNGGGVWGSGNFHLSGDEWERLAHVQLFSKSGEIELDQQVGIRIHGSGSRAMAQKSLRLYAREVYGEAKMEHELFKELEKDEFDVLVLRNMGQDFITGVAQDVLANRLINNMYQATLADRPVISFINGEYWGIQNLRERFDKHYLSEFHELDKDSVDIIENYWGAVSEGDNVAFFELYNFIENNDLSVQSNYEFVEERMHIADFIDNTLTRIYLGCYDWPGNNTRIWRERSEVGKFRWLLLDNDGCMGNASYNSLQYATEPNSPGWPNPPESTLFLRKLLENEAFKMQFVARMAHLLNTAFDRLTVGVKLTDLYNTYKPEYDEHDSRWKALEETSITENYEQVMEVVRTRSCHVRSHFINYFNLQESEFPYDCDSSALVLNADALPETESSSLIYPNPNLGRFHILLSNNLEDDILLDIYDIHGSIVFSEHFQNLSKDKLQLNLNSVAAGIYIIQIRNDKQLYRVRMIISNSYQP